MARLLLLQVFVLTLLFVSSARSASLQESVSAYIDGEYSTAFSELEPWAQHGNAQAQHLLGNLYAGGFGVPQDYHTAAKWYKKAAEQGVADAQYSLGNLYLMGYGTSRNYKKAASWFRKAAHQNVPLAQLAIGELYRNGIGTTQSATSAYFWFSLAANNKASDAGSFLEDLSRIMTPDEISKANVLVKAWKPMFQKTGSLGEGLEFQDVLVKRGVENGADVLTISGSIVNVTSSPLEVPIVSAVFFDCTGNEIRHFFTTALLPTLSPGDTTDFEGQVDSPPPAARRVDVTFLQELLRENLNKPRTEVARFI